MEATERHHLGYTVPDWMLVWKYDTGPVRCLSFGPNFTLGDRAIRNGCDLMLKNFNVGTNHGSDQKSATGLLAMRRAVKNILFVVVNSRAYAPENLDTGMLKWEKTLLLLNAISGLLILGLGALSVRTYRRKKKSIFATQG